MHVPLMGMEDAHVTESDAAVWTDGKFVAGAKGVRSVVPQPAAGTVEADIDQSADVQNIASIVQTGGGHRPQRFAGAVGPRK